MRKELLFVEPHEAYIRDKSIGIFGFILLLCFMSLFLVFLSSFYEKLIENIFLLFVALFLVVATFWGLLSLTVFAFGRHPLEIRDNEIRLPFPWKRKLMTVLKGERDIIDLRSIVSAKLEFRETSGFLSHHEPETSWKCTFELKDGRRISLSSLTPGCETPQCLDAIKKFVQIVDRKTVSNVPEKESSG